MAAKSEIPLPELPRELAELAEFPLVEEDYDSVNELFGRAYREEQAAGDAQSEDMQRYHLLLALAHRRRGLELAPQEPREHQRFQNHLLHLGQSEPPYVAFLIVNYHDLWAQDPHDPLWCYLFGRACMLVDQFEAAEALFARGLRAAPHDYWLNIAKGAIAYQFDDLDTAIKHLERAAPVGLTVGEMGATRMLGRVYASAGRYDAAAEKLTFLLQAAPRVQLEDFEILATCWKHLDKHDEAEQLLLYDIPEHIVAAGRNKHLRTLGNLYLHQARYEAAEWAFEAYLEFHPEANDRERIEALLEMIHSRLRRQRE